MNFLSSPKFADAKRALLSVRPVVLQLRDGAEARIRSDASMTLVEVVLRSGHLGDVLAFSSDFAKDGALNVAIQEAEKRARDVADAIDDGEAREERRTGWGIR